MTLIEKTYTELRAAELVATRVQFSRQYVGKNPNWYSYQTHMRRDFSVSAAVECLRALKQHEHAATLDNKQTQSIHKITQQLDAYLREQHLAVAYA